MTASASKFDLPEAIIFGGFALFADILSFVPFVGSIFLMLFWGIFKFRGLSAPLPLGSMFLKIIPLLSLVPVCSAYVWRVYMQNQPGGVISSVASVADPKAAVAAVAGSVLPGPGSAEYQAESKQEKKKAA